MSLKTMSKTMKKIKKLLNKLYNILPIFIIGSLSFIVGRCTNNTDNQSVKTITKTIQLRDTVINHVIKGDTVRITDNQLITKVLNDTVWIERKPRVYNDSTKDYTFKAEAVELDWYQVDIHCKDTVTMVKEIETVKEIENIVDKHKPKFREHFKFSIGVYGGWSPIYRKPDLIIGGGFGYTF